MKKILFLLCCFPLLTQAGTPETRNDSQSENESTKISLYIPGFLMKVGSWFVDREKSPEVKEALTKLRSVSICVREGCAYKEFDASGKFEKKTKKMKKQGFEEMLSVSSEDENVSIGLRQNNKGVIRQVVIIADDGEKEFVFVRLRCDVQPGDIAKWVSKDSWKSSDLAKLVDL